MVCSSVEMLIIGTGARSAMLTLRVRSYLYDLGINIEAMDTHNAASTFNMLVQEGRSVAAALLPANVTA